MNLLPSSPEPATRSERNAERRLRFRFPRFGLRSLFVFAILFCLFFGWIGRNAYRLRQDEAAIEALKRGAGPRRHPGTIRWFAETPLVSVKESGRNWERMLLALGLSEAPRLRWVYLNAEDRDDERVGPALEALKRFPEIEQVGLEGRGFDDGTIAALARLPNLKTLLLYRTSVTAAGFAPLADSLDLQSIDLDCEQAPKGFVAGLASVKSLRTLTLSGDASIGRSDFAAIASLPQLERLLLWNVRPTEEVDLLSPLENARSLEFLGLGWKRPDDVIRDGPYLPTVKALRLSGINDETLAKWPSSSALREAQFLAPLTPEAVAPFSAANPDCEASCSPGGGQPAVYYRKGDEVPPPDFQCS